MGRAGVCAPRSRAGQFLIDHAPERPGLFVAAGDSGHAFKFTPVLGGLVADGMEGRTNPWLARFAWRAATVRGAESARATG